MSRVAGWVAMLAVIGNIVASAFCCAPRSGLTADMAGLPFAMVICTAEGLKSLLPHGSLPGAPERPACPTCVLLATVVLAVALILVALLLFRPPATLRFAPIRVCRSQRFAVRGFQSRGPPVFA